MTVDRLSGGAIRFDRQLVSQLSGGMRFGPLKSAGVPEKRVPIGVKTAEAITVHVERWPRAILDGADLVFATTAKNPVGRSSWSDAWAKARGKVGAPGLRSHDIRHLYASMLIESGESIVTVSKRLGQATVTETLNTYAHLIGDNEQRTRDTLDDWL